MQDNFKIVETLDGSGRENEPPTQTYRGTIRSYLFLVGPFWGFRARIDNIKNGKSASRSVVFLPEQFEPELLSEIEDGVELGKEFEVTGYEFRTNRGGIGKSSRGKIRAYDIKFID